MSTHIFYKENLPYKSRFSNRKLLHDKTSKTKMNICSEGPFHHSLLEFLYVFQFSKPYWACRTMTSRMISLMFRVTSLRAGWIHRACRPMTSKMIFLLMNGQTNMSEWYFTLFLVLNNNHEFSERSHGFIQ